MKKRLLAVVAGCMLCVMATGCGSQVNAEPGDYTVPVTDSATTSNVPFATAVSTEAGTPAQADAFETNGLDLTNLKTVSLLEGDASHDEEIDSEFTLQVYADAQKKLLENSYVYSYQFDGGSYKMEVADELKKNVSQVNCEWMTLYPEVSKYIDGSKYDSEDVTVDCSMGEAYELVYVHAEVPDYSKSESLLEDRYYIKENATGNLSLVSVSVVRDTAVYGEGSMTVTRAYMDDVKAAVYAAFLK